MCLDGCALAYVSMGRDPKEPLGSAVCPKTTSCPQSYMSVRSSLMHIPLSRFSCKLFLKRFFPKIFWFKIFFFFFSFGESFDECLNIGKILVYIKHQKAPQKQLTSVDV